MQKELQELKSRISSFHKVTPVSDADWESFTKQCTIVLMAGGESTRFKEVAGTAETNKNAFALPNGDTMIEMTIRMYRDAGFKRFAALLFHKSESIENLLGDGSQFGVEIFYSYDPGPVGKGGAIRHAVESGVIAKDHYFIIQNPDDVIWGFEGSFPRHIVSAHLEGEKKGCLGTVVVTEESPYEFTGMRVNDNMITDIEMYPMVPIPAHIGTTVFSYNVAGYFSDLFDYAKKSDFEKVLFPILADEQKLYAVSIPTGNWIAVNNAKAYKKLVDLLSK